MVLQHISHKQLSSLVGTGGANTNTSTATYSFPGYNNGSGIVAPLLIATITGDASTAYAYTWKFTLQSSTTSGGTYTTVTNGNTATTVISEALPDTTHTSAPYLNHTLTIVQSTSATTITAVSNSGTSGLLRNLTSPNSLTIDRETVPITGTSALANVNSTSIDYQITMPSYSATILTDIENSSMATIPSVSIDLASTSSPVGFNGMTIYPTRGNSTKGLTNINYSSAGIWAYVGTYGASNTAFSGNGGGSSSITLSGATFMTVAVTPD